MNHVLILYFNYIRCNHWGKLGEEYKGALFTIFANYYDSVTISK